MQAWVEFWRDCYASTIHDPERRELAARERVIQMRHLPADERIALARELVRAAGYAVVPVEPTQDMADFGGQHITLDVAWGCIKGEEHTLDNAAAKIYRAMIAAAHEPTP